MEESTLTPNNLTENPTPSAADRQAAIYAFQRRINNSNIPSLVMLILFAVVGIVGNLIVVLVYWRIRRKTASQIIIFAMGIFDLFTSSVVIPGALVVILWLDFPSLHLCRFIKFAGPTGLLSGMYLLVAVSVVRYRMVCRPHLATVTSRRAVWMCVACVGVAMLFGVFYAAIAGSRVWHVPGGGLNVTGAMCSVDDAYRDSFKNIFLGLGSLTYSASLLALVVLNALIGCQAFRHRRRESVESHKQRSRYTSHSSGNDVTAQVTTPRNSLPENQHRGVSTIPSGEVDFHHSRQHLHAVVADETSGESHHQAEVHHGRSNSVNSAVKFEEVPETSEHVVSGKTGHLRTFLKRLSSVHPNAGMGKTTLVLSLISLVYVLSYLPYMGERLYSQTVKRDIILSEADLDKYVLKPLSNLIYLGCVVNPIIYSVVDVKFRRRCRLLFRSCKRQQ